MLNTTNIATGILETQRKKIDDVFSAGDEADSLAAILMTYASNRPENYYLHALYRDTASTFLDTSTVLPDTLTTRDIEQKFVYTGARVISNSIANSDNYITIDRGSLAGVKTGMGVVSGRGIVGIVKKVSKHYSLVMSLLHQKTEISASIRRNRYFGSLKWSGIDSRFMTLGNVPKFADIVKGDTLQTSGYSDIFPSELPIGTIDSVWVSSGSNFYSARVRLFNDMSRLRNVYVIDNRFATELEALYQKEE